MCLEGKVYQHTDKNHSEVLPQLFRAQHNKWQSAEDLEWEQKLHLHARELALPHPSGRGELSVRADLPPHMCETWSLMGFASDTDEDPFEDLE